MPRFDESELVLLEHWKDARLLENALENVRTKFAETIRLVIETIQKKHSDLDASKQYFAFNASYGEFAIGRADWPKGPYGWPSGFSVEELQLENLTSPDGGRPYKCVWIHQPRTDPKRALAKLRKGAEKLLTKEEFGRLEFDPPDKYGLGFWCWLDQPREEIFKLLVEDDARGFIRLLADHFDWMVRFAPLIDDILMNDKRGRR